MDPSYKVTSAALDENGDLVIRTSDGEQGIMFKAIELPSNFNPQNLVGMDLLTLHCWRLNNNKNPKVN